MISLHLSYYLGRFQIIQASSLLVVGFIHFSMIMLNISLLREVILAFVLGTTVCTRVFVVLIQIHHGYLRLDRHAHFDELCLP